MMSTSYDDGDDDNDVDDGDDAMMMLTSVSLLHKAGIISLSSSAIALLSLPSRLI